MDLLKWDPFREIGSIRDDIDHIFDSFLGRFRSGRLPLDSHWSPLVDLEETKDSLLIRVELPGMKKEEIKVAFDGENLHISGERKQVKEEKNKTYHRIERSYGRFERVIPLPMEVENEKVKATYQDGILEITLPKSERAKPKEVAIEVK